MKTSNINVHDMLSVWSVEEVEKHIGEVPGVESVTLNYASATATVRYDETRLEVADIKSAVRQRSYESFKPEDPAKPLVVKPGEEKDKTETNLPAKTENPDVPSITTTAVKPVEDKAEAQATPQVVKSPEEKTETPATPPVVKPQEEKDKTDNKPPVKTENPEVPPPTPSPVKPSEEKAETPATPSGVNTEEEKDKTDTGKSATMDHSKMDHSKHGNAPMGMEGHDHHAMIADYKKRFYVVLILTVPIMLLSTMIQEFIGVNWQLRRLDAAGLDLILAEAVPDHGLGLAIMDRLRKAAADHSG